MSRRAGVYVRLSQDREGRELGVARQEEDCRALAGRRGWTVAAVYADNDQSATKGTRRRWRRLLADLDAGEIDAVIAYSSSRMYRRLRDLSDFLDIVKARRVEVATVASGDLDLSTADGRMLAGILASVDQAEAERIGERVKRSQRSRREAGLLHAGGRKTYPFLRQAADMILSGYSVSATCRAVSDGRVHRIRTHHLKRSLLSGRAIEQGHITPDEQALLRARLTGKTSSRPGARRFVLSGIATCGRCGSALIGNGRNYRCPSAQGCGKLSVNAWALESFLLDKLPAEVRAGRAETQEDREQVAELRTLEERRDALGEAFAAGDMTAEQVRRATILLDGQIDELRQRVAEQAGDLLSVESASPKILLTNPAYRARWEAHALTAAEVEEARAYIRRAFAEVTVNAGTRGAFDRERVTVGAAA